MKNKLTSVKNHFNRHRFAYGVAIGVTIAGSLVVRNSKIMNEFLTEHGLLDAFYAEKDR